MRHLVILLFAILWLTPAAQAGTPASADSETVTCVSVSTEARPSGQAFNHIVKLDNGCDCAVRCDVSTDVNPEAQQVSLAPGQKLEVLTFRGSPARVFAAKVVCRKQAH